MSSRMIGAPLATVPASAAAKHRVMRHSSLLRLDRPGPDQAVTGSAVRHATGDARAGGRLGVGRGDYTPLATRTCPSGAALALASRCRPVRPCGTQRWEQRVRGACRRGHVRALPPSTLSCSTGDHLVPRGWRARPHLTGSTGDHLIPRGTRAPPPAPASHAPT